jgi:hypothetical protein
MANEIRHFLSSEVVSALVSGDELQFGRIAVDMVFRTLFQALGSPFGGYSSLS